MTTAVRTRAAVTSCVCGCGRPAHGEARGLARYCYRSLHEIGGHLDYPRLTRALADIVEDWPAVSSLGLAGAAERLGMTTAALDQALVRAVRRGLLTKREARPWSTR